MASSALGWVMKTPLRLKPDPPDIAVVIELERGQPRPEGHVIAFLAAGQTRKLELREVDQAESIRAGAMGIVEIAGTAWRQDHVFDPISASRFRPRLVDDGRVDQDSRGPCKAFELSTPRLSGRPARLIEHFFEGLGAQVRRRSRLPSAASRFRRHLDGAAEGVHGRFRGREELIGLVEIAFLEGRDSLDPAFLGDQGVLLPDASPVSPRNRRDDQQRDEDENQGERARLLAGGSAISMTSAAAGDFAAAAPRRVRAARCPAACWTCASSPAAWPAPALAPACVRRLAAGAAAAPAQVFFPEWLGLFGRRRVPRPPAARWPRSRPARRAGLAGASSQMISASAGSGSIVADFERGPTGIGQLDRALVQPRLSPARVRRRWAAGPVRLARATGSGATQRPLRRTPGNAAPGSLRFARPEPGDPMRTLR